MGFNKNIQDPPVPEVRIGNVYEDNSRTPKRRLRIVKLGSKLATLEIIANGSPRGPKTVQIQTDRLGSRSKKNYSYVEYQESDKPAQTVLIDERASEAPAPDYSEEAAETKPRFQTPAPGAPSDTTEEE